MKLRIPPELSPNMWLLPLKSIVNRVDGTTVAVLPPESAANPHCTVVIVGTVIPRVIVTVISCEHHCVVVTQCITNVTRVPGYQQPVVVRLTEYNERTVLGPVPAEIA